MPQPSHRIRATLATLTASGVIALGLAGGAIAAETDRAHIESADTPQAIDGSYIVTLADSIRADTANSADRLAERYDGSVTHTYAHSLGGFAATMTEADALRLAADPAVERVQADQRLTLTGEQPGPPSPGLDRIDQRDLPLDDVYRYPDSAGADTTVYVIDTGVRVGHDDFGDRASSGYDFIDDDTDAADCNGHGTHLAGTAAGTEHGVAKLAEVVAVRVLDCNGSGTTSAVVAGVDWVAQAAADTGTPAIANFALGGGIDQALDDAVAGAIESGVSFAVTAGSSGGDACQFSPARVPSAFTVGGTRTETDVAVSNGGPCVDIYAPATDIVSTWHTADDASEVLSGSSATAHAAGALALYLSEHPEATPAEAGQALVDEATPVTQPGGGTIPLLYTGFMVG